MVTRSSNQVLLLIMVIVLALKDCDASKDVKKVAVQAGDGIMVPGRKEMSNAKEMFVAPAAEDTREKFGGRKLMAEAREVSNKVKKEGSKKTVSIVEAPKISGRKDMAKNLKKPPAAGSLMNLDDQTDAVERPVDAPNSEQLCSNECADKKFDNDAFQKLGSEKLLEAGLMNKDYSGVGNSGPINNHEPLH